jgi:UDP-glucose 4-epimerase
MKGYQILVTGANGFVGQRLLNALFAYECKIRILSSKPHSDFETIICDLEQDQIPDKTLDSVDVVFHLAGYAHDFQVVSKVNHIYHKVNVDATLQLAKLAVQHRVKSFVFVSSVKAGGSSNDGCCATEDNQHEPDSIYGKTKREAELELIKIGRQTGMHITVVRPSLVYGPGVKGNLMLMLSGIEKGWFPPLPEVGNRRSLIHVDDLVRALLLVAEDERANGEIYIATDGHHYSSREIYETMLLLHDKHIPQWSVPKLLFDLFALVHPLVKNKIEKLLGDECYSSKKLQSMGFQPQRNLQEMNETDF